MMVSNSLTHLHFLGIIFLNKVATLKSLSQTLLSGEFWQGCLAPKLSLKEKKTKIWELASLTSLIDSFNCYCDGEKT